MIQRETFWLFVGNEVQRCSVWWARKLPQTNTQAFVRDRQIAAQTINKRTNPFVTRKTAATLRTAPPPACDTRSPTDASAASRLCRCPSTPRQSTPPFTTGETYVAYANSWRQRRRDADTGAPPRSRTSFVSISLQSPNILVVLVV